MYWIYLSIFVVMVFVPEFVRHDFWGLSENTIEELYLFFLGLVGYSLFLAREKQLFKAKTEKTIFQKEVSRLTKDLTASYSYIGETNRKLEILKSIVLNILTEKKTAARMEKAPLYMIIQAVHALTKYPKIILRLSKEHVGVIKEVKSDPKIVFNWNLGQEEFWKKDGIYVENDECFMFVSQKYVNGVKASLIIVKDGTNRTIDDPDMLKILVFYALFIFIYCEENKRSNKLNNSKNNL